MFTHQWVNGMLLTVIYATITAKDMTGALSARRRSIDWFEVVTMDGHKIEKVHIKALEQPDDE